MLAQQSDRDKGLPEVPVLDDAADDWLQLLRLAQAGPAGAAEQQASIALVSMQRAIGLRRCQAALFQQLKTGDPTVTAYCLSCFACFFGTMSGTGLHLGDPGRTPCATVSHSTQDQAKRVMQLLHKYNIASLWPAYAQLLARTLPVGPASSRSGTEATLELLAMSRRWDLKQVEQVITHALKQRLDAVSGLAGHQCAVS